MYWNHRVVRRIEQGEEGLYVVEMYYNSEDDSIMGWTENESAWGTSVEEIRTTLTWMLECLDKPVLDEVELLAQAEANPLNHPEHEEYETIEFDELLSELGMTRDDLDTEDPEPDEGFSVWDQD